jgi:hypothetical protein
MIDHDLFVTNKFPVISMTHLVINPLHTGHFIYLSQWFLNLLPNAYLLGLVKDSRTTDLWSGFLVISNQEGKVWTTIKISILFVVLAEYSAIRMEGVKIAAKVFGPGCPNIIQIIYNQFTISDLKVGSFNIVANPSNLLRTLA